MTFHFKYKLKKALEVTINKKKGTNKRFFATLQKLSASLINTITSKLTQSYNVELDSMINMFFVENYSFCLRNFINIKVRKNEFKVHIT